MGRGAGRLRSLHTVAATPLLIPTTPQRQGQDPSRAFPASSLPGKLGLELCGDESRPPGALQLHQDCGSIRTRAPGSEAMTVSEQALVQWTAERSCPSRREGLSRPGARSAVIRMPKDCVLSEGSQLVSQAEEGQSEVELKAPGPCCGRLVSRVQKEKARKQCGRWDVAPRQARDRDKSGQSGPEGKEAAERGAGRKVPSDASGWGHASHRGPQRPSTLAYESQEGPGE
uniref:Uncharacterized protein n=1 Tax=Rangifer tarandus platyrhynchus TaxID=3082113 RepID=A0ACB0EUF2_RANTA|nr:unnamed protein product [Rangifer tarandus platyrhynchus]